MIQEELLELHTRSNTGTEKQQNCRRHVRDKVGFWLHHLIINIKMSLAPLNKSLSLILLR
jgi:hypothetical protein